MNKEDIIRMAVEANLWDTRDSSDAPMGAEIFESIEYFAGLVATAEREECALVAERGIRYAQDGYEIAEAIRARSQPWTKEVMKQALEALIESSVKPKEEK